MAVTGTNPSPRIMSVHADRSLRKPTPFAQVSPDNKLRGRTRVGPSNYDGVGHFKLEMDSDRETPHRRKSGIECISPRLRKRSDKSNVASV